METTESRIRQRARQPKSYSALCWSSTSRPSFSQPALRTDRDLIYGYRVFCWWSTSPLAWPLWLANPGCWT